MTVGLPLYRAAISAQSAWNEAWVTVPGVPQPSVLLVPGPLSNHRPFPAWARQLPLPGAPSSLWWLRMTFRPYCPAALTTASMPARKLAALASCRLASFQARVTVLKPAVADRRHVRVQPGEGTVLVDDLGLVEVDVAVQCDRVDPHWLAA